MGGSDKGAGVETETLQQATLGGEFAPQKPYPRFSPPSSVASIEGDIPGTRLRRPEDPGDAVHQVYDIVQAEQGDEDKSFGGRVRKLVSTWGRTGLAREKKGF
ncbi:MAG: hypothetical protein Q7S44_02935 [bacterium]|nr:hypothetical protein [bacterium]